MIFLLIAIFTLIISFIIKQEVKEVKESRYIKISKSGQELSKNASQWACVLDEKTNLYWEVKTNSGIHNKDSKYRWGGKTSLPMADDGQRYDDWNKLIDASNNGLCGFHRGWRVPLLPELRSIVDYENLSPAINTYYFPNTLNNYYWSSSPYVDNEDYAWKLNFKYGIGSSYRRTSEYAVRLVRGGQ